MPDGSAVSSFMDASEVDVTEEAADLKSHVIACRHRWSAVYLLLRQQNRILYVIAGIALAGQFLPPELVLSVIKAVVPG